METTVVISGKNKQKACDFLTAAHV